MGKRKQGSRAAKRAAETYKDFEQALTEQAEQDRIASKPDDELFVIDTQRKETSRKNKLVRREQYREKVLNGDGTKKKGKHDPSDKDLRQIQRVLENHGQVGAVALAQRGRARLEQKRQERRMAGMSSKGKPTYDLWDEPQPTKKAKLVAVSTGKLAQGGIAPVEILPLANILPTKSIDSNFDAPIQPAATLSKKQIKARKHAQAVAKPTLALEIAHPGQSYRPDKEQHQDAIGEALSIEIRRNEAEEYKAAPISNGMSAFTQGFIIRESDSEESSDDEEDEDEMNVGSGKLIKKKDKLTRAQRNKQKRVKAEQTALLEKKQEKQFMHQINEVKKHDKAVKEADKKNLERQKELAQLKEEKKAQPLGKDLWNAVSQKDPIRAPSLPVALTEELEGKSGGGSLRTVTPKGSLVTDRLESMVARGMIQKKKVDGRRIVQGKRRKKVVGEKGTEYLLI
ncbi:hypothetical protein ACHAWO_011747 [Cyclotella atomus]|uniref:Ribosome biogenesis protein NOP53 n=1 Tax=Cyclotella atomus TaxID=382360 RepID=A0ABD3MP72_9STRA